MESFWSEMGSHSTDAVRLLVACLAGGLIGLERELKGKPAGMRTTILICLGSCLVMLLSIHVAAIGGGPADPGRIAAQVVTGVGFLGAGTIIRSRVSVGGLTSAATIWFVAALGLVFGAGSFVLGLFATTLTLLTLTVLNRFEHRLDVSRQLHIVELRLPRKALALVRVAMDAERIAADDVIINREGEGMVSTRFEYVSRAEKHEALVGRLETIPQVELLVYY